MPVKVPRVCTVVYLCGRGDTYKVGDSVDGAPVAGWSRSSGSARWSATVEISRVATSRSSTLRLDALPDCAAARQGPRRSRRRATPKSEADPSKIAKLRIALDARRTCRCGRACGFAARSRPSASRHVGAGPADAGVRTPDGPVAYRTTGGGRQGQARARQAQCDNRSEVGSRPATGCRVSTRNGVCRGRSSRPRHARARSPAAAGHLHRDARRRADTSRCRRRACKKEAPRATCARSRRRRSRRRERAAIWAMKIAWLAADGSRSRRARWSSIRSEPSPRSSCATARPISRRRCAKLAEEQIKVEHGGRRPR